MELARPKLMADSLLTATYSYMPDLGPDCPILAIGGTDDAIVSMADLAAWQAHTRRAFRQYLLPGNHFFVRDAPSHVRTQLLEYICRPLRPQLAYLATRREQLQEIAASVEVEG
jgi:medium-chain acyl-[acyl-carrier-protein] hydrolase